MKFFSDKSISILSLVVAAAAFIVSVRSCQISQESFSQSRIEYRDERSLVLRGEFDNSKFDIRVLPTDQAFTFMEGTAYLPPSIYSSEIPIDNTGTFLHMGSVSLELKKFLAEKIPKEKGYNIVSPGGKLPLLIDSHYVTKGQGYTDKSLYLLALDVVVYDEEYKEPDIKFVGLLFYKRFPENTKVSKKMLDELISREEGIYIPSRRP